MLVLDTDHLSEIEYGTVKGIALTQRMKQAGQEAVTTIVTVEEQLRGWLAELARSRNRERLVAVYELFQSRIGRIKDRRVLPFSAHAASKFAELRSSGIRTATMDLRIASIALIHGATLLTRNLKDIRPIPGLVAEDWL